MQERRKFFPKLFALASSPFWAGNLASADSFSPLDHSAAHKLNCSNSSSDAAFWAKIRAEFPITEEKAYLNAASFGPSPYAVSQRLVEAYQKTERTAEASSSTKLRQKIATLCGATEKEICLMHNTSRGINTIAWGLALKAGDEVIISSHEHVGGALAWIQRAKVDGIKLRVFEPATTGSENIDRIKKLIRPRTRAIAVPHISCTTGNRLPLKEIADLGHQNNLFVFADGAHGPGSTALDLQDYGVDAYAGCGHKWLSGPAGTAFLYIKEEQLSAVQTYGVGAYSDASWTLTESDCALELKEDASRFFYGTHNSALLSGFEEALTFFETIGMQRVETRISELHNYLREGLLENKKIELLSPNELSSRGPMLTFRHKRIPANDLRKSLSSAKIRVRQIYEASLDAIRVSTHVYNSYEELDRVIGAIQEQ